MRVVAGPEIADVRAREGRIEAVESSGYVPLASAPLFAVDATGVHRALDVVVHSAGARTFDVVATLDTAGLHYPIALDPLWSTAPSMAAQRELHTATLLADGRVLVAGGSQFVTTGAIASCEIFDPKTNTWSAAGSMVTRAPSTPRPSSPAARSSSPSAAAAAPRPPSSTPPSCTTRRPTSGPTSRPPDSPNPSRAWPTPRR